MKFVCTQSPCPVIGLYTTSLATHLTIERLGESGATHDSQSASRSGVEAWVARNLNGWDDSDAGLSQAWVRCPSGLASLHHSRLSTRSSYQLYSFSGDRRFCYDNHGSFVHDSPNLFCGPSGSDRTHGSPVRTRAPDSPNLSNGGLPGWTNPDHNSASRLFFGNSYLGLLNELCVKESGAQPTDVYSWRCIQVLVQNWLLVSTVIFMQVGSEGTFSWLYCENKPPTCGPWKT